MKTPHKTSILYFDDEQTCLDIFHQFFSKDYDVQIVSTLAEAQDALARHRFDIVISDQLMPKIDGLTFLRQIAITHSQTFRMMLTGSIGIGEVISEVSAGIIQMFITKPWTESNMRQVFERINMAQMRPERAVDTGMPYNYSRHAA